MEAAQTPAPNVAFLDTAQGSANWKIGRVTKSGVRSGLKRERAMGRGNENEIASLFGSSWVVVGVGDGNHLVHIV